MKKILLLLPIAAMWGCTDYVSQWDDQYGAAFAVKLDTSDDGACTEGFTTSVRDGDCTTYFICRNSEWTMLNVVCDTPPTKICEEGATSTSSDGVCTLKSVCSNNTMVIVDQSCTGTAPSILSSSSKAVQSSSSKKVTTMSSASKTTISNEITYTEVSGTIRCPSAMFCGPSGKGSRVETGKDDGTDTYGYWFTYDDSDNGGASYFTWPYGDKEDGPYGMMSFADLSVEQTGAIIGSASIDEFGGLTDGYLGLGFNVGGELQKGYDISAWKGLCIIYKANAYMALEIHPANEATVTKYDNPLATLYRPNKTTSAYVVNIPWNVFEQSGWGKAVATSTVLKSAATISFKFTNNTSFSIYAIGKYGTCN